MRPYHHLPGYLHRWRLFGLGRFMIRIHRILKCDGTHFLHTHPFYYVSIILKGGYTETVLMPDGQLKTVSHGPGSVIIRSPKDAHRITEVRDGCTTLFFTWKVSGEGQGWQLFKHESIGAPQSYWDAPDGLYATASGFRRRLKGVWHVEAPSSTLALSARSISIHQDIKPEAVKLVSCFKSTDAAY